MKAISLHQPWAAFVCLKWKTIETRTHNRFKSLKGQRIAIHAARKVEKERLSDDWLLDITRLELFDLIGVIEKLKGKIICTAKVVDARWAPNVNFFEWDEWNERAKCDVAGKYCLFLNEIQPLKKAIPYRGRQGIFNVPDEVIES